MNLTPASSSDLPSEAILTRVSESGTRLMHTAIFMGAESKPGHCYLATAGGLASGTCPADRGLTTVTLEIRAQAHLHMSWRPGREPALHRRGGRRGILGEGAERIDAPVEQVTHCAAQL